ncbi:hypothetical protein [Pseudaestuariivita sp.]|uniref:hypothetical protein n=1 Tax=Pseudaestuariivita sp. TaxID=2211669 RepID=UPI004058A356
MLGNISKVFRYLNALGHYQAGAGSWSLRPHEEAFIEAVLQELSEDVANVVRRQLARKDFVERSNPRINVLSPFDLNDVEKIDSSEFDDALYNVRFRMDGKRQTAHVTFYERRLFSVETKLPGKSYIGKTISVEKVERGMARDTMTKEIDRSEHG